MGDCGNGLHLYGVHLLERVIKNTGSINGLEAKVFVVKVAYKERLCREGVRLYIHILQRVRSQLYSSVQQSVH